MPRPQRSGTGCVGIVRRLCWHGRSCWRVRRRYGGWGCCGANRLLGFCLIFESWATWADIIWTSFISFGLWVM
ncbi:hypothetical protein E1A91_A07G132800v1 [Gossypium mustelinum]|uniref:Uncharacterized protein n=1 Tax=Gossypium mustelinum TaxID=34275 RepID=A0A5D2YJS0_GOSMU|nr:hypothetical protein E1A91_A07G132800v1 [Gossypium mustelinum]